MQFSVTTTEKSGIIQSCERMTRLGDATISGTASLLAEFTNYSNEFSREVWALIFSVYGGWQYEDGNQSDLPASVATLTSGQTTYALPSGSLTVKGIEVKDTSGNWTALQPITEEEIRAQVSVGSASGQISSLSNGAVGQFMTTSGQPRYFQLVGQTVRMFPASNWTQASSFKVFYDRGSVSFLTTDTTKTPGFASEFHDVIPLGASCAWYEINAPEDNTYIALRARLVQKKMDIQHFYESQGRRLFPSRLRVRQEDNR